MAFPKKTQVSVASNSRSQLDLSCQHVTTSDFLQFQVSKYIEMVPGQSVNIQHECFSRLDPMPVPTFGRANIVHRAFFVPMRTIFPSWNDFITDTPHYFSTSNVTTIVPHVPFITNDRLAEVFLTNDFSTVVDDGAASDFTYITYDLTSIIPAPPADDDTLLPQISMVERKFTPLGRFAYKLLRSLGITIVWTNANTDPISLLKIFACIRVFYDFYYPSQYINDDDSAYLIALLTRDIDPSKFTMDITGLQRIFKILSVIPYASDYFTSAWDNPTSPSDEHFSDITIEDVSLANGEYTQSQVNGADVDHRVTTADNGTPVLLGGITQFALNALRALTDYMKRHQISGSRALDRYLSRFGVKLTSEKLNRCMMLTEYSQELQFGDVTSTADTVGAALGDYAGKGISYGENGVSFSTDEYGYLLIISTISPVVQYFQGIERSSNHITRLDFWTPEFDNLGTQAIGLKELYCPNVPVQYDYNFQNKIFGFAPRYAEYKIPYSQLTGDLSLDSFAVSSEPWTLFRDMEPLIIRDTDGDAPLEYELEHGINFIMSSDKSQYNRIFYNTDDNTDHFKMIHNFRISSSFPGKSFFDTYQFENEDKSQKVTMQVNGTTVE